MSDNYYETYARQMEVYSRLWWSRAQYWRRTAILLAVACGVLALAGTVAVML